MEDNRHLLGLYSIGSRKFSLAGRTSIEEFEHVFREYQKPIFNFLLRMTGNYDSALDLTQDVFVRALRNWAKLKNPSRVRFWLFRIAKNVALRARDKSRQRSTESLESWAKVLESSEARPDEQLLRQEEERTLQKALSSLPAQMRLILLLKEREGLDYREIAQVLGCSEGTVASRLNRARRLLGRKIERLR